MTAWATLIIECVCVWALLREQQKLDKTGDFLGNIKPTKGEHIKTSDQREAGTGLHRVLTDGWCPPAPASLPVPRALLHARRASRSRVC